MKKLSPLMVWIKRRIEKNQNVIIVVNGPTGSGKTYSAIELCRLVSEMFGTNFNIKENVGFKFTELLKSMELPHNDKPGTPFLFEEVGAFGGGASSREWQSKANKFFFSFMQTSRHKNQIFVMTCPQFTNLEAGARSLVHLQIQTLNINHQAKIAFLRPYIIQVNSRTGKFYFKFIRYKTNKDDKRKYKLKTITLKHIPKEMADEYEQKKTKYTTELNRSIIEMKEKPKRKNKKVDPFTVISLINSGLSKAKVASELGISLKSVYNVLNEGKKLE